jgi:hypothetical protein
VFGRGRRSPVFGRGRRPSVVGAEARWCQSPRFSASLIGLRVRVCGGAAGTVNVGFRAPADPSFIWRCARGGPLPRTAGAPDQGASRIGKPIRRSGPDPEIRLGRDHIPNKEDPTLITSGTSCAPSGAPTPPSAARFVIISCHPHPPLTCC